MSGEPRLSPAWVASFRELFDGRRDCHGEGTGRRVTESVDDHLIAGHLRGDRRVGIYLIAGQARDRCKFAVTDVDVPDWEVTVALAKRIEHYGLTPYIEVSKAKGYHVFTFFSTWVLAWKARAFMLLLQDDLSDMIEERLPGPLEVFPKQDCVPEGGFGNYINLPYFGKDAAKDRTVFVFSGEDGAPTVNAEWHPAKVSRVKESDLNHIIEAEGLNPIALSAYERGEIPAVPPELDDGTGQGRKVYRTLLDCAQRMWSGGATAGSRNEWTFRLAIHFKRSGYTKAETVKLMYEWNGRNTPPLGADELAQAIASAYEPKNANESLGCDKALIKPICSGVNCPVYRKAHPDEVAKASGEDLNDEPPDPTIIHLVEFNPSGMVFKFARADLRYTISQCNNKRGGSRALVIIEKDGETLYRSNINLDSQQIRKQVENGLKKYHAFGVERDLMNISAEVERRLVGHVRNKTDEDQKAKQGYVLTEQEETAAVEWIEEHPHVLYDMVEFTSRMGLVREKENRCLLYLMFTSRKMQNPISGIGKGESSSGKSFLAMKILTLIPEEDVVTFTKITGSALYYRGEFSLQHKILFIFEAPGADDAQGAVRTFITEGDLILSTVQKNPETGRNQTEDIRIKGPLCFYTTTTALEVHAENETRFLNIYADETEDMTRACLGPIAYAAREGNLGVPEEERKLWLNLQRMLKTDQPVIVPYAEELRKGFPTKNVRARRDFGRLIELIKACAFLHQFHREWNVRIDKDGNPIRILLASVADYAIVKRLVEKPLMKVVLNIKPGQDEFLDVLSEVTEEARHMRSGMLGELPEGVEFESGGDDDPGTLWISSSVLRTRVGKHRSTVYKLIKALEDEGLVRTRPNSRPLKVAMGSSDWHHDVLRLPTIPPEDLFKVYEQDQAHLYDPLGAPDFQEIYAPF